MSNGAGAWRSGMGSSYGNFAVVGAVRDAVIAALGTGPSFLAAERDGAVVVFPAGGDPSSGRRLSAELGVPVVGALVHDDAIFSLTTSYREGWSTS